MAGANQIWVCKKCKLIYWRDPKRCEDCGGSLRAVNAAQKDIFISSGYTGKSEDKSEDKSADKAVMGEFLDELVKIEETAQEREQMRKQAQEDARAAREQEEQRRRAERAAREQEEQRRREKQAAREREEQERKLAEANRKLEEQKQAREETLKKREQQRLQALEEQHSHEDNYGEEDSDPSGYGREYPVETRTNTPQVLWNDPEVNADEVRRILAGLNLRKKKGATDGT